MCLNNFSVQSCLSIQPKISIFNGIDVHTYSTRSVRFGEKPSILRQLFFPSAMTVGNPLRMIENGKVVCDRAGGTPPPFQGSLTCKMYVYKVNDRF